MAVGGDTGGGWGRFPRGLRGHGEICGFDFSTKSMFDI